MKETKTSIIWSNIFTALIFILILYLFFSFLMWTTAIYLWTIGGKITFAIVIGLIVRYAEKQISSGIYYFNLENREKNG